MLCSINKCCFYLIFNMEFIFLNDYRVYEGNNLVYRKDKSKINNELM